MQRRNCDATETLVTNFGLEKPRQNSMLCVCGGTDRQAHESCFLQFLLDFGNSEKATSPIKEM
jgi:hypothetical protein